MPFDSFRHSRMTTRTGFTLLEVIAVLALISVFTVLAVSQHAASDAGLIAQTQVLAAHLRYAQMRSMNAESSWGIVYNSTTGYYRLFRDAPTNIAQLPGEAQGGVNLKAMGITISSAIAPNSPAPQDFELRFDSWGAPLLSDIALSDGLTLRLAQPGHPSQDLTVIQNTGFIN